MRLVEIGRRAARRSPFRALSFRTLSFRTLAILGLGVLAAISFVELADEVLENEADPIDRAISLWVHRLDSIVVRRGMRLVTDLGSVWFLGAVAALVTVWALAKGRRALAGLYAMTALASGVLIVLLKLLFQRPRPDLMTAIAAPDSFSFPSGHAMGSIVVFGMAAFVGRRLAGGRRRSWYGLAALVVSLVGFSRVYLGVHWTTDVLAGYAAGAILLAAAGLASERLERGALR